MGDKVGVSAALNSLADLAVGKGDIKQAREYLDRSLTAARDVSARESEAFALGLWGEIAEFEGAKSQAITYYRDALMIYDQISMPKLASPFRDKLKRLGAKPHPEGAEN